MKKNKTLSFTIITIIASLAVLFVSLAILFFALTETKDLVFPSYTYSEYVDRSDDGEFSSDAGAQLYEAESLDILGSASAQENVRASGGNVVGSLYTGSSIELYFYSDASTEVEFYIATSYLSQTNRQSICSNLFTLEVNDETVSSSQYINPSYNEYDFIETYIATIKLVKGYNTIDVVSLVNSYTIDYIVLVSPEEKTTSLESIGYDLNSFSPYESRQTYYAFMQREIEGAAFIYDEDTLEYSVFFSNPDDSITFYIESDEESETSMSVSAKKSSTSTSTPGVSITVNGKSVSTQSFTSMTYSYSELNVGTVTLNEGINTVKITNLGGYFYLESIVLNQDVNLSPSLTHQRFEAENAEISGCSVTQTIYGSGEKVVGSHATGSSANFTSLPNHATEPPPAVRISYAGSVTRTLSEMFSVTVSNTSYQLPDTEVESTDYNNYFDVYIGKVSLSKGTPSIKITSVSGYYNLDCITLFTTEYSSQDSLYSEAEDMLTEYATKVYSTHASNGYYVRHDEAYSAQFFYFYAEEECQLTLTLAASYTDSSYIGASTAFNLMINSESVSYESPVINKTSSMTDFEETQITVLTFKEGLNVLKVINNGYTYGIDYLLLSA